MPEEKEELVGSAFELEYVTSVVSVVAGGAINVNVVNDSSVAESTRVVIYQNTGAGAVTVVDTGRATVTPTWNWAVGFTVKEAGAYWLRVQATSESLIPKASFHSVEGVLKTVENYRPGEFAVFSLTRKRLW